MLVLCFVKRQKFIPLLVVVAGLLAYRNSFTAPFIFDDITSIVKNPTIRRLWPLWGVVGHTSRPVVRLSLAMNYALGGLNPWGYHLLNVVIHILAALILYGVVRRTCLSARLAPQWREAGPWLAAAIAVVWVVHPLQTESVTYIIQRCESLMGLFYLLTLYCVIRSRGSSRSVWWETGAVVNCALAMGCKPVAASAPVVVFLYERAFMAGSWREILPRRWKMYAGLAATWLLLPLLLANGPHEWQETAGFGFGKITPAQYALTQPGVIVHYLRLAFWPRPLCLDYAWPPARTAAGAWPGLIAVGVLLVVTVWAWGRKPALGFIGAWFFIILAPTSSFIPIADLAVEHRMYLSLAAVVTAVVVGAFTLGKRLLGAWPGLGRLAACGMVGVVVPWLATLTIQRNSDYGSELRIWQDTVVKCPGNPRVHYNLGVVLGQEGRIDDAIGQYEQALRIEPDNAQTHCNLGIALRQEGKVDDAIGQYEQALRIEPGFAEAHYNLGIALRQEGKIDDAIGQYEQALRIKPDYADAHNNLGTALRQAGKIDDATEQYEQALRIDPDFADAHYNLGTVLGRAGRIPEAIEHLQQALRIEPDLAEAHCNLGIALGRVGKIDDAIGQYEQALRIKPDYADAHYNLGNALEHAGRVPEAIQHYEQALKLRPDLAPARNALARLQARP